MAYNQQVVDNLLALTQIPELGNHERYMLASAILETIGYAVADLRRIVHDDAGAAQYAGQRGQLINKMRDHDDVFVIAAPFMLTTPFTWDKTHRILNSCIDMGARHVGARPNQVAGARAPQIEYDAVGQALAAIENMAVPRGYGQVDPPRHAPAPPEFAPLEVPPGYWDEVDNDVVGVVLDDANAPAEQAGVMHVDFEAQDEQGNAGVRWYVQGGDGQFIPAEPQAEPQHDDVFLPLPGEE